jgi:predicted nucleic acid-binding protein
LRRFFDSSVLVPVFYADHPHHAASAAAFIAAGKEDSFCALHTLAEVYATLTGLPLRPRITGRDGIVILKQILGRLTLVSLSEAEYIAAIEEISATITGGATYDALIARCAVKVQADVLLTWNLRDFTRFSQEVAALVKTPLEATTGREQ